MVSTAFRASNNSVYRSTESRVTYQSALPHFVVAAKRPSAAVYQVLDIKEEGRLAHLPTKSNVA